MKIKKINMKRVKKLLTSTFMILTISLSGCVRSNSSEETEISDANSIVIDTNSDLNTNYVQNVEKEVELYEENFKEENEYVEQSNDINLNTDPYSDSEYNVDINFDEDVTSYLNNIKNTKVDYYYTDILNVEDSLKYYDLRVEADSSHNLKYIKNNQIDKATWKKQVETNNKMYLTGSHETYYDELTSSDFSVIFDTLVETLNTRLDDTIDIYELDDKLDSLKIFKTTSSANGLYDHEKGIFAVNTKVIYANGGRDFLKMVSAHETNHLVQSGSSQEKEKEGFSKNLGILYSWDDLKFNSLNYQWFVEASAEQLMIYDNPNLEGQYTYVSMLDTMELITLSNIYKDGVEKDTLAKISLQSDLNALFDYFSCETQEEKEEIIKMMYTFEIVNNSANTEFKDAYKEKFGESFYEGYKDLLKCQCAESLSKVFYYNLIKRLDTDIDTLENIFQMISLYEHKMNSMVKLSRLRNEDQKNFIETYTYVQNQFFKLLANDLGIEEDAVYTLFNNYCANNKISTVNSVMLNESQVNFVNEQVSKIDSRKVLKNIYLWKSEY